MIRVIAPCIKCKTAPPLERLGIKNLRYGLKCCQGNYEAVHAYKVINFWNKCQLMLRG